MRLVAWNCCAGPLARKLEALAQLEPDVAVLPESPQLPSTSSRQLWFGTNPKKGIAVLASNRYELVPLQTSPDWPQYVIPVQVSGPVTFLLLAIWTQNGGADRYVRGLVRAVAAYETFITSRPTVLLGDFNSNSIWDHEHPSDRNHSALVQRLASYGLESAYHTHYAEAHGAETRATFYEYRHAARPYHIDYCFMPVAWRPLLRGLTLGTFGEWRHLSDHVPLLCELDATPAPNPRMQPTRAPEVSSGEGLAPMAGQGSEGSLTAGGSLAADAPVVT